MRRSPLATVSLLAMGLSAVALVASVWSMSTRLAEREVQNVLFGEPILDASFTYLYEPGSDGEDVEITYLKADEAGAETPVLRIGYRGLTTDYPVFKPPTEITEQLPGLLAFRDWFKVVPMVTGAASAEEAELAIRDGVASPRMIIVARYLPEGFEDGSWGTVRRQEWVYRFAELHAPPEEPAITVEEKTYRQLDALHTPGIRAKDEDIPTEAERERDLWMHFAMQQVTPPQFMRAKDRKLDEALEAMGWTWPVAGVSIMTLVASGLLLAMASKPRPTL